MVDKSTCRLGADLNVYAVRTECGAGPCPGVYEVKRACGIGSCPSVQDAGNNYCVIGRQLSSEEVEKLGLEKKVGDNEGVVEVLKSLLRGLGN